jgi:hypothetical protein
LVAIFPPEIAEFTSPEGDTLVGQQFNLA